MVLRVQKESIEAPIGQRRIATDRWGRDRRKLLLTLAANYKKAPWCSAVYPTVEACLKNPEGNLAQFVTHALDAYCSSLNLQTPRVAASSASELGTSPCGQDRVLWICKHFGATHHINAIGGLGLFDRDAFEEGVQLSYLKTREVAYPQFGRPFVPHLSIVDAMMFNAPGPDSGNAYGV